MSRRHALPAFAWPFALGQLPAISGFAADPFSQRGGHIKTLDQQDLPHYPSLNTLAEGHFTIRVPGDHPFRMRMLMLFVRLLNVPDQPRGSRRTRDGRTPFVRQVQAAAWFLGPHPNISQPDTTLERCQ